MQLWTDGDIDSADAFPEGMTDVHRQQIDLRAKTRQVWPSAMVQCHWVLCLMDVVRGVVLQLGPTAGRSLHHRGD
jgi:hypothetical protein